MDMIDTYNITDEALEKLSSSQLEQITNDYFDKLESNREEILQIIEQEEKKFNQTMNNGLKELAALMIFLMLIKVFFKILQLMI